MSRVLNALTLKNIETDELRYFEIQDEGLRKKFDEFLDKYKPTEFADELKDVRVGHDGTVYKTAGEAVRQQVKSVFNNLPTDFSDSKLITSEVTKKYVIDYSKAQVHKIVLKDDTCQLEFSESKIAEGTVKELKLYLVQGLGSNKVQFPDNVLWQNGNPPVLSFKQGSVDVIHMTTLDQGQTWYASYSDSWVK